MTYLNTHVLRQLLNHIPGSLELLWSFQNSFDNKWALPSWQRILGNRLPNLARQWQVDLETVSRNDSLPHKKVLFFTGRINVLEHGLATMFALAHRNCTMDFVWFDNLQLDQPDDIYHRRKFRYFYKNALDVLSGNNSGYKLVPLGSIPPMELSTTMVEAVQAQAYTDVVYITRRETVDIQGMDRSLFQYRVQHGCEVLSRLLTLIQRDHYDVLVTPNGAVLEFGLAYRLCQLVGLPAGTYEFWGGQGEGVVAYGPSVMSVPTGDLWSQSTIQPLSPERRQRACELMQKRVRTQNGGLSREQLYAKLSLRSDAPVVLICPNVPFDGLFLGQSSLFPSMHSWLTSTVSHLIEYPAPVNIIVRAHPHETIYQPDETALSILQEGNGNQIERICLIPPRAAISTYDLMSVADLGLVYSSTTGLEMATYGLPVVCGNQFHYNGKGFTYDPCIIQEYFQTIDQILAAPSAYRLSPEQIDKALSYLDIYFNQFPVAFPWTFADFWRALNEWPMRRVISAEGDTKFGASFDRLVGRI